MAEMLTAQLKDGTLAMLNEAAEERGVSRSELIRTALAHELQAPPGMVPLRVIDEAIQSEAVALGGLFVILNGGNPGLATRRAREIIGVLRQYVPKPQRAKAKAA